MLKGIGFSDDDLSRPLVGVATTWIETMPCNFNQRELAQRVKAGIREAGGTPIEFNTISVSDGVSMGTEGMKASLISREVIADSIELVARGHLLDGLVCPGRLRQDDSGRRDGAVPAGRARPGALQRLDRARHLPGRDITIQDVFEAVGAYAAEKIDAAELHEVESAACPGAGACGGQFTANTMATALEFLGLSPGGMNGIPALNRGKGDAAEEAGRIAMRLVREDVRPSQIVTREALENAAASVAATGGSTNGVLHVLAIARELGIAFSIDDFDTIASRTPIVASLKPGGKYVATDIFDAGGVALVARELARRDLIHAGAMTVDGRTLGEIAEQAVETPGQPVVVSIEAPIKPTGGLAVLRGNLSPEGCVVKLAGHERTSHRGPARVFESEEECFAAVKARRIEAGDVIVIRYEGPARRPRHAGDAARHRRHRRRGTGGGRCADHRRPLLRGDPRADGRPRHARGGPRRADRDRARRRHDPVRHRRTGAAGRAERRRGRRAARRLAGT